MLSISTETDYVSFDAWMAIYKQRQPNIDLAKAKLGWVPEITAHQMCIEMVQEDLQAAQRLSLLKSHGHAVAVPREQG